ncbi:peptidyl-prolyl cis-trans isomerase [Horticoccus luteus]|uniref:Peptidyl-prolyl cis-trans isomerase n=1 Tax=Horticoccus luteus TaxID=2862869 RepID=A0A8F9XI45_9BACT|nr:peptidyl-prolyl cis-trans isomerase [Horticoccus luteus]QYM80035.1 peptidyl-prolyl cis-trans isomerase [Horticoccus luteus]
MISWIQRTFQRHFKIVFLLILAAMAIPLIVIFTPSSGIGGADRHYARQEFFGLNLGSPSDQARLMGDAQLSVYLQAGGPALEGAQMQQYALTRYAALNLADRFHLPASTSAEVAEHIKTLRAFSGQDGEFDAQRYARFRDSLKTNPNLSEADVARIVGDDVRVQKLQKLLAGPGYLLASDVRDQLARADSKWTLAVATADFKNFNPTITPTDAELAKYFADNSARYEIPPRVVASYIQFPSSAYLGAVNITDADAKAYFNQYPGRFQKPAGDAKNPAATKPAEAADFELVRPQVETALKAERARKLALKAASDFSLALYEGHVAADSPALASLVSAHKLVVRPLAPFTHDAGPAELGGSPDIADAAFKLNTDRWFTDALAVPEGAVVLFYHETQPTRQPQLAEVRAKVTADYVENEKRQRFAQLGRALQSAVAARLKAGDTFEKAVAASSSALKVETKQLAPFTLRDRPSDLDYSVLMSLDRLSKGQLSDVSVNGDKATLVYVVDKQVPDLAENSPAFTAAREQIAQANSGFDASAFLDEVVERELARTAPKAQ